MKALYDKCIAWVDFLTPDAVNVYVHNQNAPVPDNPRVSLRIVQQGPTAHYRDGVDPDNNNQPVTRWFGFTLALEIFGSELLEAEEIASFMMDFMPFSEARIDLMGRDTAFHRLIAGPLVVDSVIGARIEPRVTLDLQMSATNDLVYEVGPIETVELAGDVESNQLDTTATTNVP